MPAHWPTSSMRLRADSIDKRRGGSGVGTTPTRTTSPRHPWALQGWRADQDLLVRLRLVRLRLVRLRSKYPDDCMLRVLDSLLLGGPLPFHQVRERFPLVLDLLADRLALSLPVVSDLDAALLFEEIRERLLLGLDQVRDRLALSLQLVCDLVLNRLHPLLVLRRQLPELVRKSRAWLFRHGLFIPPV